MAQAVSKPFHLFAKHLAALNRTTVEEVEVLTFEHVQKIAANLAGDHMFKADEHTAAAQEAIRFLIDKGTSLENNQRSFEKLKEKWLEIHKPKLAVVKKEEKTSPRERTMKQIVAEYIHEFNASAKKGEVPILAPEQFKLAGEDISGLTLYRTILRNQDLRGTNLEDVKIIKGDFTGVQFDKDTIVNGKTDFTDAKGLETTEGLELVKGIRDVKGLEKFLAGLDRQRKQQGFAGKQKSNGPVHESGNGNDSKRITYKKKKIGAHAGPVIKTNGVADYLNGKDHGPNPHSATQLGPSPVDGVNGLDTMTALKGSAEPVPVIPRQPKRPLTPEERTNEIVDALLAATPIVDNSPNHVSLRRGYSTANFRQAVLPARTREEIGEHSDKPSVVGGNIVIPREAIVEPAIQPECLLNKETLLTAARLAEGDDFAAKLKRIIETGETRGRVGIERK